MVETFRGPRASAGIDPSAASTPRIVLGQILKSRALWTLVVLCVAAALLARWIDLQGGPSAFRARYGRIAPLVTLPLHGLFAVAPLIPSDGLCVANGMLYGFWLGAAFSWMGWWVGGILAFLIGARSRKELRLEELQRQLPSWLRSLPVGHPLFLILVRQIPYIGGDATTFLPGAAGVPLARHLWCSALAIVPGSLLMSAIGVGLLHL